MLLKALHKSFEAINGEIKQQRCYIRISSVPLGNIYRPITDHVAIKCKASHGLERIKFIKELDSLYVVLFLYVVTARP